MTIRTNAVQTCDRCMKPFNEKHLKSGDAVPTFKQRGLVILSTTGSNADKDMKQTPVLSFDDMCPDCQNAVDNLIDKIRLDGAKKKKAPAKKRGSKSKEKPKPPVTEYSETTPAESKSDEGPAEKPGPDGEPATSNPSEDGQESKSDAEAAGRTEQPAEENSGGTTEEPAAEAASEETTEEPPAEGAESGGNGAEASSGDDDNLMTDPATGDVYDKTTGEVVSRGNAGESKKHPF